MFLRPAIFISGVSKEFKDARDLLDKALRKQGFEPIYQEIFETGHGDIRDFLRKKIDRCQGVIQLVGYRYGFEPPQIANDAKESYTQFEANYAKTKGKPVWYFVDVSPPGLGTNSDEPQEFRQRQEDYRRKIMSGSPDMFHTFERNKEFDLELKIHGIRDTLEKLARNFKWWLVSFSSLFFCIFFVLLLEIYKAQRQYQLLQNSQTSNTQLITNAMQGAEQRISQVETNESTRVVSEISAKIQNLPNQTPHYELIATKTGANILDARGLARLGSTPCEIGDLRFAGKTVVISTPDASAVWVSIPQEIQTNMVPRRL